METLRPLLFSFDAKSSYEVFGSYFWICRKFSILIMSYPGCCCHISKRAGSSNNTLRINNNNHVYLWEQEQDITIWCHSRQIAQNYNTSECSAKKSWLYLQNHRKDATSLRKRVMTSAMLSVDRSALSLTLRTTCQYKSWNIIQLSIWTRICHC
jgi:hypothetical protein